MFMVSRWLSSRLGLPDRNSDELSPDHSPLRESPMKAICQPPMSIFIARARLRLWAFEESAKLVVGNRFVGARHGSSSANGIELSILQKVAHAKPVTADGEVGELDWGAVVICVFFVVKQGAPCD
jgi:hypothetical protein